MTLTISTPVPATQSVQLQTVLKMIEDWSNYEIAAFSAGVTEDYTHEYLPANAGLPTHGKEKFIERVEFIKTVMTMQVEVKDIIETPGVVILYRHQTGIQGKTKGGNVYDPEVLFFVYTAEQSDGTIKVTKSKEYVDTVRFAKFAEVVKQELTA
ncbi:hypothetical protein EUX98_g9107 [Antrodiella citrinella]|uniref:SnoaL-like domain-containing protein n=1 Tax=Antrodiella citrinella TaxID=2447956 RepID=A0A4S4LYG5_9APHY|nr:hypothetical protein EUX98_g9107 [Antrodiella citrinella]